MKHLCTCLLIVLVFSLASCDNRRVYEKNIEFPQKAWLSDSVMRFQFNVESSRTRYNLYYNIRNTLSYPFQNMYIRFSLEDEQGNLVKTDLVNQDLFHVKTGRPFGSGLGSVFDHQFLLLKDHKFNRAGVYDFSIQHYMRPDTLREVVAVGVRLEKAGEQDG